MSVLDLFDLHGKRALITGASTGIGKRVALAYVEAGAQVAIAARHLDALEKLADEIGTSGGKVVPVCCDVSQHQQVTSMLDQVTAELGGIDIAVCNAGIITVTPMLDMPLEEFQRLQNTNVTGVFLTAQAAAKAMVKQGQGGVIINTASMSGHIINVPQQVSHYCASKAAVIHLTKAMAVELAPHKNPGEQCQSGLYPDRARRTVHGIPAAMGAQDSVGPVGPARRTRWPLPVSG